MAYSSKHARLLNNLPNYPFEGERLRAPGEALVNSTVQRRGAEEKNILSKQSTETERSSGNVDVRSFVCKAYEITNISQIADRTQRPEGGECQGAGDTRQVYGAPETRSMPTITSALRVSASPDVRSRSTSGTLSHLWLHIIRAIANRYSTGRWT